MTVADQNNDVDRLAALRNRLASEIDLCDKPADLTQLARQFLAVIAHLAEIQPSAPSRVDEIAEKYAGKITAIRSAGTASKTRSARTKQSG